MSIKAYKVYTDYYYKWKVKYTDHLSIGLSAGNPKAAPKKAAPKAAPATQAYVIHRAIFSLKSLFMNEETDFIINRPKRDSANVSDDDIRRQIEVSTLQPLIS